MKCKNILSRSRANTILLKKEWPYNSKDRDTLSHFGGDPLYPDNWSWPVHRSARPEEKAFPMHFLAQIDCEKLPTVAGRELFPNKGIFYFFVFNEERLGQEEFWGDPPACSVRHFSGPVSELSRRPPPDDIMQLYPVCRTGNYDRSIINEIQTEDYMKRHGFVPMSFHEIMTTHDPQSYYSGYEQKKIDREKWLSDRENVVDNILGPMELLSYPSIMEDPSWPETVFQARLYLKLEQSSWVRQVSTSQNMLDKLKAGETLFDHINIAEPKNSKELERVRKFHMKALPEYADKVSTSTDILAVLDTMSPSEAPPDNIRNKIRSLRTEFDNNLYHEHITKHLLRVYAMDEVPVSKTSIAYARQTRQKANCNENQLLGFPRELQSGSPASALRGLKRMGWASEDTTESDLSLLAQFDTCSSGIDISWGDSGILYFYGLTTDLVNQKYERVYPVLEGC